MQWVLSPAVDTFPHPNIDGADHWWLDRRITPRVAGRAISGGSATMEDRGKTRVTCPRSTTIELPERARPLAFGAAWIALAERRWGYRIDEMSGDSSAGTYDVTEGSSLSCRFPTMLK